MSAVSETLSLFCGLVVGFYFTMKVKLLICISSTHAGLSHLGFSLLDILLSYIFLTEASPFGFGTLSNLPEQVNTVLENAYQSNL